MFEIRISVAQVWSDRRFDAVFLPRGDALGYHKPTNAAHIGLFIGMGIPTIEQVKKCNGAIQAFLKDGPVIVALGKRLRRLSPMFPVTTWVADESKLLRWHIDTANSNEAPVTHLAPPISTDRPVAVS
ncbi:hypothetical protein [Mesorhizobium sp. M8A.F.Ca.ET.165.01.1.1]|uniref:hypothetical protein n=1 Tax=Mesorhizobium sp. M8A.F.Ca.ET.165.01.1.1 TaxID=2563960 RepID=UPI001093A73E|nr:hypothetical protein [Mesorhizobium sp. M8A.F.Ca.ET.165.01.1.1]TGT42760.1 hypothetical protein EN808_12825 [Mesorhizobium sp. M8A.F.Ca.ET.165.01.1.1]